MNGQCETCVRLRLQCLGFGAKRPEWMRVSAVFAIPLLTHPFSEETFVQVLRSVLLSIYLLHILSNTRKVKLFENYGKESKSFLHKTE